MGLDIRWPIGLMFTLIGVLLTGYDVLTRFAASPTSFNRAAAVSNISGEEISIDLIWGIVLLIFGALMLLGAIRGKKNPPAN